MAVFNEPTKWQTSLVNSGDANVIPQSTPVGTGEASFDDGFPQITQVPIGAGGIAPDRKDFNGLFKILGDWIFFAQNGGISTYSENFDYVAGRVVSYNDNIYKCIQANGVSSTVVTPDSDTAYWQRLDNFVRSVNGVSADTSGNVTITASEIESFSYDIVGYIRYKNGLQVCWGSDSSNRARYTSNATLTFAKPFYDTNYAIIGAGFFINSYAEQLFTTTTTSFTTSSHTSLCGTGGYIAIGRWK